MKKTLLVLLIGLIVINYFSLMTEAKYDYVSINDDTLISEYLKNGTVSSEYLSKNSNDLRENQSIKNNLINPVSSNLSISSNLYSTKSKRDYNYLYYTNGNDYLVVDKNDIKKSIYNGLNEGKDVITLYCNYDECLNDFHSVYKDKLLMASINNYVSPYNRYSSTKYKIKISNGNVKIELLITKKYTEEQMKEIDDKIDYYLNKLDLNKMSTGNKIKWAHDFIVNRNKYDVDAKKGIGNSYNAYGAIVENKAVCQGYAEAMAILLDRFDIPNIMVSNNVHVWNLVNVNGKWLHLDATWDDPITSNGKQLREHDYYLISSKKLLKLDNSDNHVFNSNNYLETLSN